ncbi:MAG: hypothetical protein MUP98_16730 [Candidatus Aminicenantes bacterium]|nr:hypothetical protein [Candidatus Aminicenantes bacterium]
MWIINTIIGKIFDIIFLPFKNMSPWIGMIVVSLLTGLLMLFIYKLTSNQEGIKKIKNKIKAHLLEIRLFKDSLSVSFRAQGSILMANFKYIGYALKPLLVMILPILLILIQLDFRFGYNSLDPEQNTILRVQLGEGVPLMNTQIDIKTGSGIVLETPPLRIEDSNEINWRIRAEEMGVHEITITVDGQEYTKSISIGQNKLNRISPLRTRKNFFREFLNPNESPLPKNSPIKAIEISYPSRKMNLFGWKIHWLIAYFFLSIIIGFSLKGFFKVEM